MAVLPDVAEGDWEWMTVLDVGARYDSNVQLVANGESDTVYRVGPNVGMKYQGTSVDMKGNYNIYADIYTRHQNLNQITQNLMLDAEIGRMMTFILPKTSTLELRESFYNAPYLPGFQSSSVTSSNGTTGGVSTPRNTTTRNVFEVDESTPLTQLSQFKVAYVNSYTWYQDPTLIDGATNEISIGLSTDWSRIDTISETGSYQRYDPFGGPITHIYSLSVEEKHDFSPVTKGTVDLGIGWVVFPALNQTQDSFIGGLSGSSRLTETLELRGGVGRNFSTNSGIGNTTLISDFGNAAVDDRLTSFLTASLSLNAARNYSLKGLTKVDIRTWESAADLRYQFTTWLQGALGYSYLRQDTFGGDQFSFNRSVVALSFQMKWD